MSEDRLDEIRRIVGNALDEIAPGAESLPPELRDPDKTTVWLRDISREDLEAWLRHHRVSAASRKLALQEYDIGKKNVVPKVFQIKRTGRTRYVTVTGSRRHPRTRMAREEAEGHQEDCSTEREEAEHDADR